MHKVVGMDNRRIAESSAFSVAITIHKSVDVDPLYFMVPKH